MVASIMDLSMFNIFDAEEFLELSCSAVNCVEELTTTFTATM